MFKNISHVIPLKGQIVEQHTKENWIFCVKFFPCNSNSNSIAK